jgi:hypothetical protein
MKIALIWGNVLKVGGKQWWVVNSGWDGGLKKIEANCSLVYFFYSTYYCLSTNI